MGRHEAFTPPRAPEHFNGAIESVNRGVGRVFDAVYAHRNAPNAALQMADALADLMRDWVTPMPIVTSSNLIGTTLARAMMRAMVDDPHRCAACYNRAVAAVPESGLHPLKIRDEYVELPLWRIRDDDRRMHAYDNDVQRSLSDEHAIDLLPRALFMTALVRLCMCDLFIHGTGGARYDRAMEIWIDDWLGVDVGSIAIATADIRLPLMTEAQKAIDLQKAIHAARHAFHDPEQDGGHTPPGARKRTWLELINAAPRNSTERLAAFRQMHEQLSRWREASAGVADALRTVEHAKRYASDLEIAMRRDWAFPLYPDEMIDDLAERMRRCATISA